MVKRVVSMKSGLEDRNNDTQTGIVRVEIRDDVSMKSGLEDRNNPCAPWAAVADVAGSQ